MKAWIPIITKAKEKVVTDMEAISMAVTDSVRNMVQGLATGIGESLGAVIAGVDNTFQSFGDRALGVLATFMSDLGKMVIAIGVAKLSLDNLFKAGSAGAFAAIAAGVALLTIGSAINAKLQEGPGFFQGGIVTGRQGRDNVPIRATPGELILTEAQQRNLAGKLGADVVVMDSRIKQGDIMLSQRSARNRAIRRRP